jgi:hypothetical protein
MVLILASELRGWARIAISEGRIESAALLERAATALSEERSDVALPVYLTAYAAVAERKGQLEFASILGETAAILRERRANACSIMLRRLGPN